MITRGMRVFPYLLYFAGFELPPSQLCLALLYRKLTIKNDMPYLTDKPNDYL